MNKPMENGVVIERKGGASAVMQASGAATLLCPRCWTAQRASRAFCWHCGADFIWRGGEDGENARATRGNNAINKAIGE